jgi:hypothetical protein
MGQALCLILEFYIYLNQLGIYGEGKDRAFSIEGGDFCVICTIF